MGQDAVERAIALIKGGDWEGARSVLESQVDSDPDDALAWALLARISKEPREKEELLEKVVSLPEDSTGVHQWARDKLEAIRDSSGSVFDGQATARIQVVKEVPKLEITDDAGASAEPGAGEEPELEPGE